MPITLLRLISLAIALRRRLVSLISSVILIEHMQIDGSLWSRVVERTVRLRVEVCARSGWNATYGDSSHTSATSAEAYAAEEKA